MEHDKERDECDANDKRSSHILIPVENVIDEVFIESGKEIFFFKKMFQIDLITYLLTPPRKGYSHVKIKYPTATVTGQIITE